MNQDDPLKFDNTSSQDVEPIDLFLDGLLAGENEKAFLDSSPSIAFVESQKRLDDQIKGSLRGMYAPTESQQQSLRDSIGDLFAAQTLDTQANSSQLSLGDYPSNESITPKNSAPEIANKKSFESSHTMTRNRRPLMVIAALAAGLLLALGIGMVTRLDNWSDPQFKPVQLAMIFQESVDLGFRPYYNCEDMKRFADTFEARHGQRLVLSEMPSDTKMLGLSYPGGFSRGSTAMLGTVGDEKVIVFVDSARKNEHFAAVTAKASEHPELNVFVVEKYGLVFAEVSPLESARMIEYLVAE